MGEIHFNVFGRRLAVIGKPGRWSACVLGPEGKRRPAEFAIPGSLDEEELAVYLADLFHEWATPSNPEVFRADGPERP